MEYTHNYDSPLGGITMASDGTAVTGLWFRGQKNYAETLAYEHEEKPLPVFAESDRWLDIYFAGRKPDFKPPLSLNNVKASAFRRAVWEILLTIPYGQIMTYGEIARYLAEQRDLTHISPQAVGGAVGHNPISLLIPCHRVVGTHGSLTGYAGGIDRKLSLLTLEKADTSLFFIPSASSAQ